MGIGHVVPLNILGLLYDWNRQAPMVSKLLRMERKVVTSNSVTRYEEISEQVTL